MPTPLTPRPAEALRLTGVVPSTATYKASNLITFINASLNNDTILTVADRELHVVAYIGDTTGNGSYSSMVAQRVLRVAAGLDSGFAPLSASRSSDHWRCYSQRGDQLPGCDAYSAGSGRAESTRDSSDPAEIARFHGG